MLREEQCAIYLDPEKVQNIAEKISEEEPLVAMVLAHIECVRKNTTNSKDRIRKLDEDLVTVAIEKLAKALDVPITFFYRDSYIITGNNIVNSGSNNAVNASDDRLISLLVAKDEQLTMAMKQTSKAQSQMDELIAMWKNK
jgi:hypothetical protein